MTDQPACRGATLKMGPGGYMGEMWLVCNTCGREIVRFDPKVNKEQTAGEWMKTAAKKAVSKHEAGKDEGGPK